MFERQSRSKAYSCRPFAGVAPQTGRHDLTAAFDLSNDPGFCDGNVYVTPGTSAGLSCLPITFLLCQMVDGGEGYCLDVNAANGPGGGIQGGSPMAIRGFPFGPMVREESQGM